MSSSLKFNPIVGGVEVQVDGIKVAQFKPTGSGMEIPAATASTDALRYDQALGVGQTWQVVTGSRALATPYTNSTGKPIVVQVGASGTLSSNMTVTVDGVAAIYVSTGTDSLLKSVQAIIPTGATYTVTFGGGNATIHNWTELR